MQCKLLDIMRARQQMMSRVNFINIQQAAYAHADPKSVKKTDNLTVFFALSGSMRAKVLVERWWNWPQVDMNEECTFYITNKIVSFQCYHLNIFIL